PAACAPVPLRAQRRPLRLDRGRGRALAPDLVDPVRPHRRPPRCAAPDRAARDRQRPSRGVPPDVQPEPGHRQRAGRRAQAHRRTGTRPWAGPGEPRPDRAAAHRDGVRRPAHLRPGHGRGRALPARFRRQAAADPGEAWPGRGADPAAHLRMPERLLASLPGRDRPGRQGAGPLQPDAWRRPSRPAAQHALPREHHRGADPRGAGAAAGPLRGRAPAGGALRRLPAPRRSGRPAPVSHPCPGRTGRGRSRTRLTSCLTPSYPDRSVPMSLNAATSHEAANSDAHAALDLDALNPRLEAMDAEARVLWALEHGPGTHVLSSSFGAQAAVALHMLTVQKPDIPLILVDTGYLFPETYRFADELTERLQLNLNVYRPLHS